MIGLAGNNYIHACKICYFKIVTIIFAVKTITTLMTPHIIKPNINTTPVDISKYFGFAVSVDCVIFGFDENVLKVLLIKSDLEEFLGKWSLLGDLVQLDEDLESASYRVLKERTGLDNVYLEQVYTFSSVDRHPADAITFIFNGTLAGDSITGSIYMGEYRTAKFTAKRNTSKSPHDKIVIPGGPPLAT